MRPPSPYTRKPVAIRAFRSSLFIVELGVLSSFAFALMLFISGVVQTILAIRDAFQRFGQPGANTDLLVAAVQQADTLLVATALLLISLGLQTLFVGRVADLPDWLDIRTLDDLKGKLLSVVVVALTVKFFSFVADWKGSDNILALGVGIAAVILSVSIYGGVLDRFQFRNTAEAQEASESPTSSAPQSPPLER